ncbi:nuclear transport factor 2 family protein [Vreelandella sp. EE7]
MDSQASERRGGDKTQVRAFLNAMEARELERAGRYLADDVVLQFPGAPPMHSLEEVVAWASSRYRRAQKTLHAIDHCVTSFDSIVICHGELGVEWLDGTVSNAVRFIDRFELKDGLICRQDVWNDLALAHKEPAPSGPSR